MNPEERTARLRGLANHPVRRRTPCNHTLLTRDPAWFRRRGCCSGLHVAKDHVNSTMRELHKLSSYVLGQVLFNSLYRLSKHFSIKEIKANQGWLFLVGATATNNPF
jgi:hypothetical protein